MIQTPKLDPLLAAEMRKATMIILPRPLKLDPAKALAGVLTYRQWMWVTFGIRI